MWAAGGQGGVRGDDDVEPSVPSPWAEALMHLHAVWLPALFAPLRRIGMNDGDLFMAIEALTGRDAAFHRPRPSRQAVHQLWAQPASHFRESVWKNMCTLICYSYRTRKNWWDSLGRRLASLPFWDSRSISESSQYQ